MKLRSTCVQSTAAAILLVLCGQAIGQQAANRASSHIQWKSGSAAPTFAPATSVFKASTDRHFVVQLTGILTDQGRAELAASGIELLAPLGDEVSYFAAVDGAVAADRIGKSTWIVGAAPINPEWKLHPLIISGEAAQVHNTIEAGEDPVIAAYVLLHEDVPAMANAAAIIAKFGGDLRNSIQSVNGVVVHARMSALRAMATDDAVQWIEPAMPKLSELNAENRVLTGVNTVNAAPYNLNGAGVKVLVFDGGAVRRTHLDFQGRVTLIDTAATSSHSTHVAGTVGGAGVANANNRGMAPGVTILSAGVNTAGQSQWLYSNPVDIEADYTTAFNMGAQIATNSIGTNTAPNNFDCKWEGDYSVTDSVIDRIVRGNSVATGNTYFRVVWAAGNERQGSQRCGAVYGTVAPPACGKNHIVVGSVDSNTDDVSSFSSWGPTDDGRMKPDISAPGCQTNGDGGVTSCTSTSDTSYGAMCGTSMATPTVTGITALVMQDYRAQFPGQPDPRNSTLKALYAHTAVDRGNPGPDYNYGYGSVRATAAIDHMRTANFREVPVSVGGDVTYTVQVAPGAAELKLTLGWDDPSGTANVVPALVNDVDLEVYSPSRVRAYPWTLEPGNPLANAVRTERNTRDNLEQVDVDNPEAGTWTIRLKAKNVPVGPQVVSLISSHPLDDAAPYASLAIDSVVAPDVIPAVTPTAISATLDLQNDSLVPGSVQLFYRGSGAGPFTALPMTLGGGAYSANLPGLPCSAAPQFYISAQGQNSGIVTTAAMTRPIGTETVYFADDMEAATPVWTVAGSATNAATGRWERANPERTASQPEDDTTPNGVNCWITGALAGTSLTTNDVEGNTELTSPAFSMVGATADTTITFMRWFHNNTATTYTDPFTVTISNTDGSTWTNLETIAAGSPVQLGWRQVTRTLGSLGIAPTAQMKLRFLATDVSPSTIVEAAIDDVRISRVVCNAPACGSADFNGDGDVGTDADIESFFACLGGSCCATCPANADFNGDGDVGTDGDIEAFFRVLAGGSC